MSAELPDMSAELPDMSAKVPDVSAKVPDMSAKVPDVSAKVPDMSAKVPDMSAKVPDVSAIPCFTKTERRGNWGLRIISLYVGVGGFMAYFVPFFNIFIRFVKRPDAVRAVPADTSAEVRNAFLGWFLLSLGAWIMNICMIRFNVLSVVWAWMPTAGVYLAIYA